MITYSFTCRNGQTITETMTIEHAQQRLEYLEGIERLTQQVAPTDSGDVRFAYLAEEKAIRKALNENN